MLFLPYSTCQPGRKLRGRCGQLVEDGRRQISLRFLERGPGLFRSKPRQGSQHLAGWLLCLGDHAGLDQCSFWHQHPGMAGQQEPRGWAMKRGNKSPAYTTRWAELARATLE